MSQHEPYRDDVELASLNDDTVDPYEDADLPIPSYAEDSYIHSSQPSWISRPREWIRPKWLAQTSRRYHPRLQDIRILLKPRLTWRYLLFASIVLYVFYCLITNKPLFAHNLPVYSGQYNVGAIDIEIPYDGGKPKRLSETVFKDTGKPAFEIESTLFTVYYPATEGAKSKTQNHYWISKPIGVTGEGYARFVHARPLRGIFTFVLWLIAGRITIPAKVDVPILDIDGQRFPVMVFSHGMASTRSDYTHYAGELASSGYVVAMIEHRDGSCPGSVIIDKDGKRKNRFTFRESETDSKESMIIEKFKEEQLAFRTVEIEETTQILVNLNEGLGSETFAANTRKEGKDFASWKGKLDFKHHIIAGHSYGATGALQALKPRNFTKKIPVAGGIILDPGKSSGPLNHDIDVPILVIHSNSWSKSHSIFYGRPHFDTVKDLVQAVADKAGASWFLSSLGTSHPSVTDAPLLEPLLLSWTTGAKMDVKYASKEYIDISANFMEFLKDGTRNGMLAENVTHTSYNEWISEERKKTFNKDRAKNWQVHVAPLSDSTKLQEIRTGF